MIKHVSLVIKPNNPESVQYVKRLAAFLEGRGIKPLLLDAKLCDDENLSHCITGNDDFLNLPDLIIVVGGDGTLLKTARLFAGRNIPILGINTGMLGFLTEFSPDEAFRHLESIINGKYDITDRAMLEITYIDSGAGIIKKTFLNDAVISRGTISHLITIHIEIDGRHLSSFSGDGIIIATATGSTGYSLSAGGPIITPTIKNAYIIIPICPHTLTIRPLIIPSTSVLKVKTVSKFDNLVLSIDGQETTEIKSEDEILFSGTEKNIHLIAHPEHNFYDILRQKFGWGRHLNKQD
ncbi:MAG: NAD(+)/NADH kinase [Spirochaetes bacterium]|jgi:NAD+ kinase|nr:NAD(+)/NADH kinase [Spirochaetota bacterium]